MSQGSIGAPIISPDIGQRAVDYETAVIEGETYYRQRVIEVSAASILAQLATADTSAIDSVHNKNHQGRFFSCGHYDPAVADTAAMNILIVNSLTLATHAQFSGAAGGDSLMYLFEDVTYSAAGTPVAVSNHNRTSSKVPDLTVTHSPTITADGTALNGVIYVPGGQKARSGGGSSGFSAEFILAPGKKYLLRLLNISGAAKPMSLAVEGYQPLL